MGEQVNTILALFGGLLLLLSLTSGWIKNRWYVSEPTLALGFGILVGPRVCDLVSYSGSRDTLMVWLDHFARITLAIALLDVATDLPRNYVWKHWRSLLVIIGLVMPLMWIVSSILSALVLGLPLLAALALGAIVTPTDPVIAHSIVSGRMSRRLIPDRIRNLVLAESGGNDVLAYPLVMLPVLWMTEPETAWATWLLDNLLWDVVFGAGAGLVIGALTGTILRRVQRGNYADETSLLTVSVTLALTLLGAMKLAGSDGLLAAFAAGLAYHQFIREDLHESKEHVHAALRRLFELPAFAVLGVVLPWSQWWQAGWPALLFAAAVVTLRRLPAVLLLRRFIGPLRNRSEAAYVGWFGPIGIAALLYATIVYHKTHLHEAWVLGSAVIAASILVHGITATPLTRLFDGRDDHTNPARRCVGAPPAGR